MSKLNELQSARPLDVACGPLCGDCVDCPGKDRDAGLGFLCDFTRTHGYTEVNPSFITEGVSPDQIAQLGKLSRSLPKDPYINSEHYRRGFGLCLVIGGETIIPLDGVKIFNGSGSAVAAGFDIGSANRQNFGPRLFSNLGSEFWNNTMLARGIRVAVKLDPCLPIVKRLMVVQVFVQTAKVSVGQPVMQAAPPDEPHNDKCRFKYNILIGRHNVSGGATHFLPRACANKPFDDDARAQVMKTVMLSTPGQGYAFLDDVPGENEHRAANCHYAEPIHLGEECSEGYRTVATITPAPLLPSGGTDSELEEARRAFGSNTSALLDQEDIARRLDAKERDRLIEILAQ